MKSILSPKVIVGESKRHGRGMIAKEDIIKGEVVFIKGGHVLTRKELFAKSVINSYLPIDDNYYLAARNEKEEDSIKLYINHSCEPNCGLRGDIVFIAIRDIKKDEELTIDYAMVDNEDYKIECTCDSSDCRKTITGFDWKIMRIQEKYGDYFAPYLKAKITK